MLALPLPWPYEFFPKLCKGGKEGNSLVLLLRLHSNHKTCGSAVLRVSILVSRLCQYACAKYFASFSWAPLITDFSTVAA